MESEKGKVKREIQAFSKNMMVLKEVAAHHNRCCPVQVTLTQPRNRGKIQGENLFLGEGLGVGKDLSLPIQEATQIGRQ